MNNNLGIFWFRQDLRLYDNLALNEIINHCDKIVTIFWMIFIYIYTIYTEKIVTIQF